MKIGVVGVGAVGSACAFALSQRAFAHEIVLVDRTRARATAVATDIRYGVPVFNRLDIRDGDYQDLAGAGLVMITAGVNEASGGATDRGDADGRLRLLETNAQVLRDITPKIVEAAPEAVLLVVTDPPDPLADIVRTIARHEYVLSTGTYLDSLRFRVHLAAMFDVDPLAIEAQVLGEHGTSEVFVWSGVRIAGIPLDRLIADRGFSAADYQAQIERDVRYANITIIEGNKASQYGISMVSARIAEMILRDERIVIPIGSYTDRHKITLSLPRVVGAGGVIETLEPMLSPAEESGLHQSAEKLRRSLERITV